MSRRPMFAGLPALAVLVLSVAVTVRAAPAAAASVVAVRGAASGVPRYLAPVDGVIVDHFRPPATVYSAGNRGIDEVTTPGSPVVAAASGVVLFAGPVGGALHVTIRHADGLRTTSSYLAAVLVHPGETVVQGQVIGLTGATFHFGVRDADGTYLDPEALLAGTLGAHLVPGPDEGAAPLDLGADWSALDQLLAAEGTVAGGMSARLAAVVALTRSLDPSESVVELSLELDQWRQRQQGCTPPSTPAPGPPGRHLLVLVGGLGSTSEHAAVDQLDVASLGYAPPDVVRFSYAGGRVARAGAAAAGPLESIPATTYGPRQTETDLRAAAVRLRALLERVARAQPGVPIDVVAHSEGGVVVRLALAGTVAGDDRPPEPPAGLDTVVTLGTPHQGADLATAVAAMGPDTPLGAVADRLAESVGVDVDPAAVSIAQLSQTSDVVSELARPVPPGVHLVAIGASGDLTVPAVRTGATGGDAVVVHLTGLHAHDRLPGAPATTREIALARAGRPPTCQALAEGLSDVLASHLITRAEDALGLVLAGHPG